MTEKNNENKIKQKATLQFAEI